MLLEHGHAGAAEYPICVLWAEVQLVTDRVNGAVATQALLTQSAIASMFSVQSAKSFTDLIERLIG